MPKAAPTLGIGAETVKSHVSSILLKLGVETRREAAAWEPEREHHPLLAPLIALRRLHLGALTPGSGSTATHSGDG